jgi:hypothetical protein
LPLIQGNHTKGVKEKGRGKRENGRGREEFFTTNLTNNTMSGV